MIRINDKQKRNEKKKIKVMLSSYAKEKENGKKII